MCFIPRLAQTCAVVDEDACYRAMDWLHDVEPVLARQVYYQVTDLLNLEVDVLFFDTTSTYFETGDADEARWRDEGGRVVADTAGARADADGADGEVAPAGAVKKAGFRTWGKSKDSREDLPQVAGGRSRDDNVRGIDGHALGAVGGDGVAEVDVPGDVPRRQPHPPAAVAAGSADLECAVVSDVFTVPGKPAPDGTSHHGLHRRTRKWAA
ncbi:hypothetical protein V5H98_07315 [Georgenia sp. M64]|uniref:hypothetical protein n=1 Tax=Georgenia sp. M64 TaxID=3120520 RepID=UPI0030E29D3E